MAAHYHTLLIVWQLTAVCMIISENLFNFNFIVKMKLWMLKANLTNISFLFLLFLVPCSKQKSKKPDKCWCLFLEYKLHQAASRLTSHMWCDFTRFKRKLLALKANNFFFSLHFYYHMQLILYIAKPLISYDFSDNS